MARQPIREVQGYLRMISTQYPNILQIKQDGRFGPETEQAVREFQLEFGLPVTGIIDFTTWDKIYQIFLLIERENQPINGGYFFLGPVLTLFDSGHMVDLLQAALNEISRNVSNIEFNQAFDTFDLTTERNVREIQRISGLPETGIVDIPTWNRIMDTYYSFRR